MTISPPWSDEALRSLPFPTLHGSVMRKLAICSTCIWHNLNTVINVLIVVDSYNALALYTQEIGFEPLAVARRFASQLPAGR